MIRCAKYQMACSATASYLEEGKNESFVDNLFTTLMIKGYTPVNVRVIVRYEYFHLDKVCTIVATCIKQGKARARKCYWNDDYPCLTSGELGTLLEPIKLPKIGLRAKTMQNVINLCNQSRR